MRLFSSFVMERHGFVAQLLLLSFFVVIVFADVSSASFLSNLSLRILVSTTNDSKPVQVSPSPSPVPLRVVDNTTANTTEDSTKVSNDKSSTADSKESNSTANVTDTPSPRNQTDADKDTNAETKKKNDEGKANSGAEVGRNCTGVSRRCKDQKWLVACILDYQPGTKEILVLIQNDGEKNLSVDLSGSNHRDDALIEIPKHGSKQIPLLVGNDPVILEAGNGACILHPDLPVSEGNFFLNLPSYDQLITPINGAYFLILTVIVFGGTWAFCTFRKRRRQGGVGYQELEMSVPETGMVNNEESAEGWDQGWDDDWDEENAVKSPAARRTGSISANGLTSRATNKDGWENDWDG